MTTVVYRDGLLAADSCYTETSESGGTRTYGCKKLYSCFFVKENRAHHVFIGFAGGAGWFRFLQWAKAGADWDNPPTFKDDDDFVAIVVVNVGNVSNRYVVDANMEPEPLVEEYHAIGSGSKGAFVALDMGANALEAVECAARRDPYTRGPFVTMKCSV